MPLNLNQTTADWFSCTCGNTPMSDGFDTCNNDGAIVEPTPEKWDGVHYICLRCEAVYNQDTFEQVMSEES